jgi:subtilisin family serine protease
MKRTVLGVFVLLFAVSTFAQEATQRYIVGTKRPAIAGSLKFVKDIVDSDTQARDVRAFGIIDGFAIDLTPAEAAQLAASNEVRYVEPVIERYAFAQKRNLRGQTTPNGINAVGAPGAWAARPMGDVNVVVIDTGVDYKHDEIKSMWRGGYNTLTASADPWDDNGHGTHVAGTIAAADNNLGVIGVAAKNVKLWSVKMLDATGTGSNEHLITSMQWVVAQKQASGGNWIVNLSLGSKSESVGEREAFATAAAAGVLIFAATGNASSPELPAPVAFPAAYPSVIAVGAVNDKNEHAYFSNEGPEVDFVGPGINVLSTLPVGSDVIAYVLSGDSAYYGSALIGAGLGTHTEEFIFCGVGKPQEFPASVRGKIALIKRGGDVTFAEKTRAAIAAGAVAVAIFNHDDSIGPWTLRSDAAAQNYAWPVVVRLSREDGEALVKRGSGVITLANVGDDYGEKSGTSMSCPHLAGAAALLWTLAPSATPAQIVNALTVTATDLGTPGHDVKYGHGSINVLAAAKLLANNTFTGISTGRPLGKRGGR